MLYCCHPDLVMCCLSVIWFNVILCLLHCLLCLMFCSLLPFVAKYMMLCCTLWCSVYPVLLLHNLMTLVIVCIATIWSAVPATPCMDVQPFCSCSICVLYLVLFSQLCCNGLMCALLCYECANNLLLMYRASICVLWHLHIFSPILLILCWCLLSTICILWCHRYPIDALWWYWMNNDVMPVIICVNCWLNECNDCMW